MPTDVTLLAAGGTIAMAAPGEEESGGAGATPALDADDLVAALPAAARAGVAAKTVSLKPSVHLTGAQALGIARAAVGHARAGGAVVVAHGTDTLEEVALLCDLLYAGDPPIVFTGAMRPATSAGADGAANLLDAVALARAPAAAGLGVLVCLAGEVHAARAVRKSDSTAPGAFSSPRLGPLGRVHEGRVELARRMERRAPVPAAHMDASVHVVAAGLGTGPELIDAALGAGADGLVAVVLGAGHVPPPFLAGVRRAAAAVPVVATVRPERGAILHGTYGFAGAEGDLRASGALCAATLSPAAARVQLMACLGAGYGRAEIAAAFAPDDA